MRQRARKKPNRVGSTRVHHYNSHDPQSSVHPSPATLIWAKTKSVFGNEGRICLPTQLILTVLGKSLMTVSYVSSPLKHVVVRSCAAPNVLTAEEYEFSQFITCSSVECRADWCKKCLAVVDADAGGRKAHSCDADEEMLAWLAASKDVVRCPGTSHPSMI